MDPCKGSTNPFCWLIGATNTTPEANQGPLSGSGANLTTVSVMFANIVVIIALGLSLIGIAYAFVQYVSSQGDPKAIKKASTALTWAIIAMIVAAAAWGIKVAVFRIFGISGFF